jgi:deoxyribonuclease IV
MIGSHLSVAGGMDGAIIEAGRLGLDCVQVFTKNQQQWAVRPLDQEVIDRWFAAAKRVGWLAKGTDTLAQNSGSWLGDRVVSHASYLINMASPNQELAAKSAQLMGVEIARCQALGIEQLVFHPGAATDGDSAGGVARLTSNVATLLDESHAMAKQAGQRCKVVLCFENVVGAGTTIGRRLEELSDLRGRVIAACKQLAIGAVEAQERVGFCIDTCHAHAAGYELRTWKGGQDFLSEIDRTLGLEHVRVWHMNDSMTEMGSRKDRHEHVGEGFLGGTHLGGSLGGFAAIMNSAGCAQRPKILETPKEDAKGAVEQGQWDRINAERLRGLLGRKPDGVWGLAEGDSPIRPAGTSTKPKASSTSDGDGPGKNSDSAKVPMAKRADVKGTAKVTHGKAPKQSKTRTKREH